MSWQLSRFEFVVCDRNGYWGGLRVVAYCQGEAAGLCRRWIEAHALHPMGSLLSPYTITVYKPPVDIDAKATV